MGSLKCFMKETKQFLRNVRIFMISLILELVNFDHDESVCYYSLRCTLEHRQIQIATTFFYD